MQRRASLSIGATYVRASLSEVAAALAALTGEPHPLAEAEGWYQQSNSELRLHPVEPSQVRAPVVFP